LRFVVFLPLAVVATLSTSFRSRLLRLRKLLPASFTSFSASRSWASFKSVLPLLVSSSRRSRRAFCEASNDALARSIALLPPPLRREDEVLLRAGARRAARLPALLVRVVAIHSPSVIGWCAQPNRSCGLHAQQNVTTCRRRYGVSSSFGVAARVPSLFCGGSRNLSSPLFTFGN
jgi:hypothetical protein